MNGYERPGSGAVCRVCRVRGMKERQGVSGRRDAVMLLGV